MNRKFEPGDMVRNIGKLRGCIYTIISVRRPWPDSIGLWHVTEHSIISDSRCSDWVKVEVDENE